MANSTMLSAEESTACPHAFKLKRKSSFASKLKSSISSYLLLHFPDSCSHDLVLAEYITVLVCNGKNQYQATQDLEAFLGTRAQEFVSWLWDLLLKYAHKSKKDVRLISDEKYASVSDTYIRDKDKDSERSKDIQSHGHGSGTDTDTLMIEDAKIYLMPTTLNPDFNDVSDEQVAEDFQQAQRSLAPWSEMRLKKELSWSCKTELPRSTGAPENVFDETLANESLRKESPSSAKQNPHYMEKTKKKIVNSSCNLQSDQLTPRRESSFTNPEPFTSGKGLLPRSVDMESQQRKKPRISVWDRLGKPCDDVLEGGKSIEVHHGSSTVYQKQEVLKQRKAMLPLLNRELIRSMNAGVSSIGSIQPESRKLETAVSTMHEAQAANNIRRKRHFGEISTDLNALASDGSKELQSQDFPQNSKRSNLIKEDSKPTPNLITEVLDVKQKLLKVEMEMSRLRSKQVGVKKDVKSNLPTHSGGKIHAEEDTKSRTVFLTNVHFAATEKALSLFFAKCGEVENVQILTDNSTGQRKGSACVTFADKDSVEKAVALSGATFFSRTLKVSRKAESTSAMAQLPGKPSQAPSSQVSRKAIPSKPYSSSSHLQWISSSEPSGPANVERKQIAT